jgi:hypothetical protein
MHTILVQLPVDRDRAGVLVLQDPDNRVVAGPFKVCGRAENQKPEICNNPKRNPLLAFGDFPLGHYQVVQLLKTGKGTPFPAAEFGRAGVIVLQPKDGEAALAEANGRFGFFIQGGERSRGGLLRPTEDGSLRLSDRDQRKLKNALRDVDVSSLRCLVLTTAKAGAKIANTATAKQSIFRRNSSASILLAGSMAASAVMGTVRQTLMRAAWHAGVSATVTAPGLLLFRTDNASAQNINDQKHYPDATELIPLPGPAPQPIGPSSFEVKQSDATPNVATSSADTANTGIVKAAEQTAADWKDNVTYEKRPDSSYPPNSPNVSDDNTSDCSHFVHEVLQKAGYKVPYVQADPNGELFIGKQQDAFQKVSGTPQPGDIIVQYANDGPAHMGIYTGNTSRDGKEFYKAIAMGNNGVSGVNPPVRWSEAGGDKKLAVPSGGRIEFYRPKH